MKHLKPLSMNPMMVKKIHSNQWIISKGRTDVTNDVRSFSYNERENIMKIKEEHIKRYNMTLREYNLFRNDLIDLNKKDSFLLISERYEKDDSITLEFSQEQSPVEFQKTDILSKSKETCYSDIERKIKFMKKSSHFDVFVLWSDELYSGKEQVFKRYLTYEEMIKCIDYLLMKKVLHYMEFPNKDIYPIHIRVE